MTERSSTREAVPVTRHGPMTAHRSPQGVEVTCLCRQSFTGGSFTVARGLLDAHIADEGRRHPAAQSVILAHFPDAETGLREPVAIGPLMPWAVESTERALRLAGAECETVPLLSMAQWCKANPLPAPRVAQPVGGEQR